MNGKKDTFWGYLQEVAVRLKVPRRVFRTKEAQPQCGCTAAGGEEG